MKVLIGQIQSLPNIQGSIALLNENYKWYGTFGRITGAFVKSGEWQTSFYGGDEYVGTIASNSSCMVNFDASKSSIIYGRNTYVRPNHLTAKIWKRIC